MAYGDIIRRHFGLILLVLASSCTSVQEENLSQYVDPSIGTAHSRWFFYTPAALPFGMAKVAPTTDGHLGCPGGWEAVGYDARHGSIEGFANFHEFQVGGLVLAPTRGGIQTVPGELDDPDGGYRSRFDKAEEHAGPGWYKVRLKDYDVTAELTATERVAFHRYNYGTSPGNLIFNVGTRMGESGPVKDAGVSFDGDRILQGHICTEPVYVDIYQNGGTVDMYFCAELSVSPSEYGSFVGEELSPGSLHASGAGCGAYLVFTEPEVVVKIGLSYTSVEAARENLRAEASDLDFDAALSRARDCWEENLSRIRVEGGSREDKVKFYTGLFHALLGRGLASDVSGTYPANDGSTGRIPVGADGSPLHRHYNTDAIWGGFWNLTQLWTLAWPEYYSDWISSQLLVYKDAGWLGDGIACSRYVSGVGTNFTGLAIAAAYNCGIRDYDVALAYEAARKDALCTEGRPKGAGKLDLRPFLDRGYVPHNGTAWETDTTGSAYCTSHTLEYAFNSYAVAGMARALGHEEDYRRLTALSGAWKNVYDPQLRLVRPRLPGGEFMEPFDPFEPWKGFQEGNAVQYTYYVPHAPRELIEAIGAGEFNKRLDRTFELSRENVFGGGTTVNAFAGLASDYNHGNQPNLHISGLFNFSGMPWLSQKWMRLICDEFYGTEGVHGYGYGQDEDQGQLGAWYVLASLGLFDVRGLTSPDPAFQIVVPKFDRVVIRQNKDYGARGAFTIECSGNGPGERYIRSIKLRGRELGSIMLPLAELRRGGRLELELGPEPCEKITQ